MSDSHNDNNQDTAFVELQRQARASGLGFTDFQWREDNTRYPKMKGGTRQEHAAVTLPDATIVALGGVDAEGRPLRSVIYLDPTTSTWEDAPKLNEGRAGHAAVVLGKKLFAMGGRINDDQSEDDDEPIDTIEWIDIAAFSSFNANNRKMQWTTLTCRLSRGRYGCAAVAIQDRFIVVMGGEAVFTHIDIIDTAANVLSVVQGPNMNVARSDFGAAVSGNQIWVAGGYDGLQSWNSVESIEFQSEPNNRASKRSSSDQSLFASWSYWTIHNDLQLRVGGAGHAALAVGSCLVVPCSRNYLGSVEVVDIKRRIVWVLNNMTVPREDLAMVTVSNQLVALGGNNRDSLECMVLYDEIERISQLYLWVHKQILSARP